jgi:hypothetical protein
MGLVLNLYRKRLVVNGEQAMYKTGNLDSVSTVCIQILHLF